jgi:hypothetical protein
MPLPDITHLQFLVLTSLLDGEQPGRCIRDRLAEEGVRKSGPAFYQLMARLEDEKLVAGWYDEKVVDGQRIKERRYRITGAGTRACHQAYNFYHHAAARFQGGIAHA